MLSLCQWRLPVMESNKQNNPERTRNPIKFPRMHNDVKHLVTIYTMFCILRCMRERLCLGAMLEYMDTYLKTVERNNPALKKSVLNALSLVNVKKIYEDAML